MITLAIYKAAPPEYSVYSNQGRCKCINCDQEMDSHHDWKQGKICRLGNAGLGVIQILVARGKLPNEPFTLDCHAAFNVGICYTCYQNALRSVQMIIDIQAKRFAKNGN